MPIKYSISTGEVVPLDYDDIERIDFTTPEGKEVMQEILVIKDFINHFADYDHAISSDNGKFEKDEKHKAFDEFEKDLYLETLKDNL